MVTIAMALLVIGRRSCELIKLGLAGMGEDILLGVVAKTDKPNTTRQRTHC
jgi:hypothetical protein